MKNSGPESQSISMANVGVKSVTRRTAHAQGFLSMGARAFEHLRDGQLEKGDAVGAAKIAGILAAKRTHELIPLCHPLALDHVRVDIRCLEEQYVARVDAEVSAEGKTGVEMEALHAVSTALLTLYDMCKPYGQNMTITNVCLISKTGGKSGLYMRGEK